MKKLLCAVVLSLGLICAGCSKDAPGKQVIENKSGFEWNDTKISLRTSGQMSGSVNVGRVASGAKTTIHTEATHFQISAKDANGKILTSKLMTFKGTTEVNKNDFMGK